MIPTVAKVCRELDMSIQKHSPRLSFTILVRCQPYLSGMENRELMKCSIVHFGHISTASEPDSHMGEDTDSLLNCLGVLGYYYVTQ